LTLEGDQQYAYLTLPPHGELRSCVGLVMAGMAARAKVGVGGLDEAVALLEDFHADDVPTRFRFALAEDGVVAEVEETDAEEGRRWRAVVELVS
jgi:putative transcriptional regulator